MFFNSYRSFHFFWLLATTSTNLIGVVRADEEVVCTHGKLFLSDTTTSLIHIIDLNVVEPLANLVVETTIEVAGGPGNIDLYSTANGKVVATVYGGTTDRNYTDGVTNWIHSGVELVNHGDHSDVSFTAPSLIPNAAFNCAQAVHFERNNGQIAIFCDGTFSGFINSTVWVLDEDNVDATSTDNAIIYNTTLLSSHHGVAVPMNGNHVLYSVPSPDRISRSGNTSDESLPSHFDVMDFSTGTLIHQLNNSSSADTHCSGYHGVAHAGPIVALACDEVHGGILIVAYDETSDVYTSRALLYPSTTSTFEGHRSAHFEQHAKSDNIVGDFNNGDDSFNLIAFQTSDTTLSETNVLPLSALQCGFAYEQSEGEVVMILMPDGMLMAYEFDGMVWTKIAELQVVEGMSACSEASLVVGFVHAFVITYDTPTIYAVDLHEVHGGNMTFTTSSLDFEPYSVVVGGVPPLVACTSDGHGEHAHSGDDHDDHDDEDGGAAAGGNQTTTTSGAPLVTPNNCGLFSFFVVVVLPVLVVVLSSIL